MAEDYIKKVLESKFNEENFKSLCSNIFKNMEKPSTSVISGAMIPNDFQGSIEKYVRLGKYTDPDGRVIDSIVVYMSNKSSFNARTMQRNFSRNYLRVRNKDALLVAFVSPGMNDWRFSYVHLDYSTSQDENGKIVDIENLTPAKRYSFIVGLDEKSRTAQQQLKPLIESNSPPSLIDIEEAFSVSKVTKDFYNKYKNLYLNLKKEIEKLPVFNDIIADNPEINADDFSKKLLGQIVFIYFLQKKGWLGVEKSKQWGEGDKNFMKNLLAECLSEQGHNKENKGKNFYNDYLEHLFYETLNSKNRGNNNANLDESFSPYFNSRIPYLNGGLFEPTYDYKNTTLNISNAIFEDIIDTFDTYNFTVHESTPLESEVAVDPEILGKVFEKLQISKEQKDKGAFYTPSNIVHWMAQKSIVQYLANNIEISKEELELFITIKNELYSSKEMIEEIERSIPNIITNAFEVDKLLRNVRIIDPAVGSGAFPMGLLTEITSARKFLNERYIKLKNKNNKLLTEYDIKKQVLEHSIYGVDIDNGAIEIARLRFWLSLVVDHDIDEIEPLPNLDYKLVRGDSLLELPYLNSQSDKNQLGNIETLKQTYFSIDNIESKNKQRKVISNLISEYYKSKTQSLGYEVTHDYRVAFSEVYNNNKSGFDIVIANPPYVSTKGIDKNYKAILKNNFQFGFADDLYYHFFIKAMEITSDNGVICFITSDTFFTTVTKRNLRRKLQSKKILELVKTDNVFEDAMVSPAITLFSNKDTDEDYDLIVKDAQKDFDNPKSYECKISTFRDAVNEVFFMPTEYNMHLYHNFNDKVKDLMNTWWDRISTSKNIEKNRSVISEYVSNLKPGDVTLLGLITDGGVGLQTGDNGKYIGVREGTKEASEIKNNSRAKKLLEATVSKTSSKKVFDFANKREAQDYLGSMSETEIWKLFEDTKNKYWRDTFGQGYIYRIVPDEMVANVDKMSDEEKQNGISKEKPTYVPYDKGDKGGNRWYLDTPFLIDWSKENVSELRTAKTARFQNSQFYFREGFCWILTLNQFSKYQKARIKESGVFDVNAMSLFINVDIIKSGQVVTILNSLLVYNYKFNFVNNTSAFQINDARQIPIVIPTISQSAKLQQLFEDGLELRKLQDKGDDSAIDKLQKLQLKVDETVESIYFGDKK